MALPAARCRESASPRRDVAPTDGPDAPTVPSGEPPSQAVETVAPEACHTPPMKGDTAVKVTLTEPEIAGSYVVAERREDGTLILRPETSEEVIEQFADRVLEEDEFLESFDRLDAALERDGR